MNKAGVDIKLGTVGIVNQFNLTFLQCYLSVNSVIGILGMFLTTRPGCLV